MYVLGKRRRKRGLWGDGGGEEQGRRARQFGCARAAEFEIPSMPRHKASNRLSLYSEYKILIHSIQLEYKMQMSITKCSEHGCNQMVQTAAAHRPRFSHNRHHDGLLLPSSLLPSSTASHTLIPLSYTLSFQLQAGSQRKHPH